jgi:transposase-like protein
LRSCSLGCAATGRSLRAAREHQISEALFYTWREKLLEGGAERLSGTEERTELVELPSGCVTWSAR